MAHRKSLTSIYSVASFVRLRAGIGVTKKFLLVNEIRFRKSPGVSELIITKDIYLEAKSTLFKRVNTVKHVVWMV